MTHPSFRSSSSLHEKTSDRAHIERNLEEMMDNDWREFRAKLVALEKANGGIQTTSASGTESTAAASSASNGSNHPELKHQGQLSELFGAAISSIFKGHQESKNAAAAAAAAAAKMNIKQDLTTNSNNNNIFDGNTIAGLEMNSEDPFVSADELPLFLPSVTIDKHRWAHEIPHVEPGCVLLANEKLGGVFHQTVVLIVQHSESTGSIGIVINRSVLLPQIFFNDSQSGFLATPLHSPGVVLLRFQIVMFFDTQTFGRRFTKNCIRARKIQSRLVLEIGFCQFSGHVRWTRPVGRIQHRTRIWRSGRFDQVMSGRVRGRERRTHERSPHPSIRSQTRTLRTRSCRLGTRTIIQRNRQRRLVHGRRLGRFHLAVRRGTRHSRRQPQ